MLYASADARLDIDEVPVLSSTIPVQQSARDLGVVIDSRLSLSEPGVEQAMGPGGGRPPDFDAMGQD